MSILDYKRDIEELDDTADILKKIAIELRIANQQRQFELSMKVDDKLKAEGHEDISDDPDDWSDEERRWLGELIGLDPSIY